jgi:Fe2+-dicitrate sensor, membrane component
MKQVWLGSLAASILVTIVVAGWLYLSQGGYTIKTELGERREVALADGSVVQIDPRTRLRVKYEEHARRIYLEQGRAFFRVVKNPNRPFLVQTIDTTVRAVGTAFAVERQNESVVVTVSEGKVAVFPTVPKTPAPLAPPHSPKSSAPAPRTRNSKGDGEGTVYLTANQQVTVQASGSAEPVRQVNSGRTLAWTEGRLIFENDTVATVVADFNRYNRVQLRVVGQRIAARPVTGVFNASDPESFVAFLQTVTTVKIARDDGQDITISSAN